MPLGCRRARLALGGTTLCSKVFDLEARTLFYSHLLPGLAEEWEEKKDLFDEKTRRIWPNVEMSSRAEFTREYVVKQFWVSLVEDKCDLYNAISTKAEFSYATALMGRIGGWEEEECEQENWVGARFAGIIWIYTRAVVCNGQSHMQNFRIFKLRSILEAVTWVCDDGSAT